MGNVKLLKMRGWNNQPRGRMGASFFEYKSNSLVCVELLKNSRVEHSLSVDHYFTFTS